MKSVRKLMGVKGKTESGRGMVWYGMGPTYTEQSTYVQVYDNLFKQLGVPAIIDKFGALQWFVEGVGVIILTKYRPESYNYVLCDPYAKSLT